MHIAYLFATLLGGGVWLAFYRIRPDLRPVQIALSCLGMPLAFSDLFYVPQYWRPETLGGVPVGVEGLLFSFEAAGICALVYPVVFSKRFEPGSLLGGLDSSRAWGRLLIPLIPLPVSAAIATGLHTNLEWGLYAGLIVATLVTIALRPDLAGPQLWGGLAFLPIYAAALFIWVAVFPSVHSWFALWRMPHLYLLGVPLEEIAFGGLFAAFWTGAYPVVFGRRFVSFRRDAAESGANRLPGWRWRAAGKTR